MNTLAASKWRRVSRQNPCPVCGKPDWCLVSQDGQAAICARIESDKKAGDAGWLHRLTEGYKPLPLPAKPVAKELPQTSVQVRNEVYRALLAELSLSDSHAENLLARGLTLEQIKVLGYKSLPLPEGRPSIVRRLTGKMKVSGVPGFALVNGEVRLFGAPGILIPVKDIRGRIVGLQIRCDQTDTGKYKWLSSAGRDYGCSPGAPVHIARPESVIDATEIWLTEGVLKADIASLKLQRIVLAVSGVGNWWGSIPIVKELSPGRVVVAYDSDRETNEAVRRYELDLIRSLLRLDVKVFEASWSQYKGLDDVLVAEAQT